jgi:DNA-binding protein YbaB
MNEIGLNDVVLTNDEVRMTRDLITAAMMVAAETGHEKIRMDLFNLLDNFLIPLQDED